MLPCLSTYTDILKTKEDIAAETPRISTDLLKGLFLARVILFFILQEIGSQS